MTSVARRIVCVAVALAFCGCTAMTGRSAGRNIDDAEITAKVKSVLATDKASTLTSVDVDTVNGVVYLNGTVANAQAKQRATELARGVGGVGKVVNNLQTGTTAADSPPRSGTAPHSTY